MDTPQAYYDDEIDLREIIQTLLMGWKVILLLTILAGAIAFGLSMAQTPVYEASATVSINQTALSISTNPASMLLGDEIRQAVADALDVSAASLPVPEIANDKTEEALFIISVQSPDAQFAAQVANAWAETGAAYFAEQASSTALALFDSAREIFTAADQALLSYMQKNRMGGLAWGVVGLADWDRRWAGPAAGGRKLTDPDTETAPGPGCADASPGSGRKRL